MGEGFKNKILLRRVGEVKCHQVYIPGSFYQVYKVLGLPPEQLSVA